MSSRCCEPYLRSRENLCRNTSHTTPVSLGSQWLMNIGEPRSHGLLWAQWSGGLIFSHPLTGGTERLDGTVEMT